jgi:microsomal epoxide hydrolase
MTPTTTAKTTGPGEPFEIAATDADLADLLTRLSHTRFPIEPEGAGWRYGANLEFLRELVEHWRTRYDWRAWEATLNRWPQRRVAVPAGDYGDIRLHYLIERGSGPKPMPLLLLHGWPGSVFEFYKIIEPLAHPERFGGAVEDAFTVICPSLPGYGFTTGLARPIGPRATAKLLRQFMVETLGIERFAVQAGDWGSVIASWMGVDFPNSLFGLHLNMLGLGPGPGLGRGEKSEPLPAEEIDWLARARKRMSAEDAYQRIQGTKPQSLAFGLTDSPVGLAAWIVEKFHGWSVADPHEAPPFSHDEMITNVMIYWLTGTIGSSLWMYWAARAGRETALGQGQRVSAPTGFAFFANDILPTPPASLVARAYNVTHRTEFPTGGHFAALQSGEQLIADARNFFRGFRNLQ